MKNLYQKAAEIAAKAHAGQFRKDGITPYFLHPYRVSRRLDGDEEAQVVALLHDAIEDTVETEDSLRDKGIPDHLINSIKTLTKGEGQDYYDYLERVKEDPIAKKVKMADMLDNLSDTPSEKQIIKYSKGFLKLLED